jgi:hypothetical protein
MDAVPIVPPLFWGTKTRHFTSYKQATDHALLTSPYLIIDGTLDECIRKFMSQPKSQHHLYEIHTAPQADLVSAILSADHVVELARLRDFLGK